MKIFRFPGIVIGVFVHVVVLVVILSNPGCSSSAKPQPSKADTVAKGDAPSPITMAPSPASPSAAPISFSDSARYSPTRPGTPAASTLEVEPVNNVTPASTYTVVGGDNLTVIAKKNHLTVSELAAANNLNLNTTKLHPGQKLIIPAKAATPAKPSDATARSTSGATAPSAAVDGSATKAPADVVKHVVKSGENLSTIALKYGVKLGDIAAANNISDPQKVRAGTELIIPGWQATGGKAARSTKAGSETNARQTQSPTTSTPVDTNTRSATPSSEIPVIQVEETPASAK